MRENQPSYQQYLRTEALRLLGKTDSITTSDINHFVEQGIKKDFLISNSKRGNSTEKKFHAKIFEEVEFSSESGAETYGSKNVAEFLNLDSDSEKYADNKWKLALIAKIFGLK